MRLFSEGFVKMIGHPIGLSLNDALLFLNGVTAERESRMLGDYAREVTYDCPLTLELRGDFSFFVRGAWNELLVRVDLLHGYGWFDYVRRSIRFTFRDSEALHLVFLGWGDRRMAEFRRKKIAHEIGMREVEKVF